MSRRSGSCSASLFRADRVPVELTSAGTRAVTGGILGVCERRTSKGERPTMIILLHSSKTMRPPTSGGTPSGVPVLVDRAEELVAYLRTLSREQLARIMSISADLAAKTGELYAQWSRKPQRQTPAAATFVGDIYSGLQLDSFTAADRGTPVPTCGSCRASTDSFDPSTASVPTGSKWATGSRPAGMPTSTGSGEPRSPNSSRRTAPSSTSPRRIQQDRAPACRRATGGDPEVPHHRPGVRATEVHRGTRKDRTRRLRPLARD